MVLYNSRWFICYVQTTNPSSNTNELKQSILLICMRCGTLKCPCHRQNLPTSSTFSFTLNTYHLKLMWDYLVGIFLWIIIFFLSLKGFQVLVTREWLEFGHRFADRCGHGQNHDENQRCPVFLQWLDCVHQLTRQFPCSFEFNEPFLVRLHLELYCLFF